jgi:hypothetical protein
VTSRDRDLLELALLQSQEPPPASPALLASVASMRPVRTRVPQRTLVAVAAAALVFPLAAFAAYPLRADLDALPAPWVLSVAVVWLAGFLVSLGSAIIPRRNQVLPDSTRAARTAVLACLTLVLMGLLFTVDAPGITLLPRKTWDGFVQLWWHCIWFSLKVSLPTILAASFLLRWVAVAHAWQLGAAIGAAAGSLAGLTLHGLCPYGGAAHVGLAHGGGVVIGALLGALWLPVLVRPFRLAA